ncbi:DapH/DapD/GlmU-related protein [Rhizobium halophytocola]|uniref:Colanic acid biosynthesis acetyltransferase WcaF n=1 Tax=Rhizobium halophytocola TaxID=735519 RepID=A0ABS4E0R1_9HYPH|nr:DapH/DapD/GlmU-related protein [Rhizobium halophytocola]MBP1851494.1 putative colanic acid biosynthesis acetyltransferase WcaF [Rhizobium halophytocola]
MRMALLVWEYAWMVFCRWTPKPANRWRLLVLRMFGTKIEGRPFVHQRARIQIPWHVTLRDRSCLGDRANLYSLGEIEIGERATIGQEAYLCAGSHDFDDPSMHLVTAGISVAEDAFVGARAFVMPGVHIGHSAVVGACSVVTRDVAPAAFVAGNPARPTGRTRSKPYVT